MRENQKLIFLLIFLFELLFSCKEEPASPAPDLQDTLLEQPTPTLSDKELLDEVQEKTLNYFWDYAHPVSGMARERSGSEEVVTSGGTGFGVQAIVAGVSHGWIGREQAVKHLNKLCEFLEVADRFHGAWSHWLNGSTGEAISFGPKDNGGDLVETSFLINGLLVARAYFSGSSAEEIVLRQKITQLWESIEWDWYASRGDNLLCWHWSPDYQWELDMPIQGWNEAFITYVLALSSPTHPISAEVYQNTWINANYGAAMNYGGYYLKMGPNYGGPLFFAHYSFLSLDPRQLEDEFANYWQQNVNHIMINRAYCLQMAPKSYGYSEGYWGLTASDDPDGYVAHHPGNDNGTVAPTAALGSFPYMPYYSMQALRYFYTSLGSSLLGTYGLKDAHNKASGWTAADHLAIDQGPIVVMIENYRTGLLWDLFTELPEIQVGLAKAGVQKPVYETGFPLVVADVQTDQVDLLKHPDLEVYQIGVATKGAGPYTLMLLDEEGKELSIIWEEKSVDDGLHQVHFGAELPAGKYKIKLSSPTLSKELNIYLH